MNSRASFLFLAAVSGRRSACQPGDDRCRRLMTEVARDAAESACRFVCRPAREANYGGLDLRPFRVVAGRLLPPLSRRGEDGLRSSPEDALWAVFERFELARARVCVVHARARCLARQHNMSICRSFVTGATGLGPATSGVTGRYGATGYSRLRPEIAGHSRRFFARRTGCDRLRPASTRHSPCGRCVVAVVPAVTTGLSESQSAVLAHALARSRPVGLLGFACRGVSARGVEEQACPRGLPAGV
jgi:hypothetical protein